MPFSDKFPLTDIMDSLKHWYEKTGNIVTFEYCVWKGINDEDEDTQLDSEGEEQMSDDGSD